MDTADRTGAGRPWRRPPHTPALVLALVVALAVAAAVCLSGHRHGHTTAAPHPFGAPPASPDPTRSPSPTPTAGFSAGDAATVVLDGVSGRIRVTADSGAHGVSGSYARDDGTPARVTTRTGRTADGGAILTVVCADAVGTARACAGDLTLTVPAHTGLRLRQTSGETVLTGIGGAITATTASDRLTARNLRAARADLTITSGSADIAFAAPPARLALDAASASVALRLPGPGGYAVTSDATSADVSVQVPRDASAPRKVALRVDSGSLALLPA